MAKLILQISILLIALTILSSSRITINTHTRQFVDSYGRSLTFHGFNTIYKKFPFHPKTDSFDPMYSLCDEDFERLHSWGFNFIRLYISWEGTEKVKGEYNMTYVNIVKGIVQNAAKHNITVLLDAHQDAMNRKFCGEGMPDWAVNVTNFPKPLLVKFNYDKNGYPDLDQCLDRVFSEYYATEDVQDEWEQFYKNKNGIQDSIAEFWVTVAKEMRDEENIIAYEILNEPFSADFYHEPDSIIDPQKEDKKYLEPFYERVHNKIREVDNDTILFFEPMVNDLYKVGLQHGPGGEGWNDKQALSYHVYCLLTNHNGIPDNDLVCRGVDKEFFETRYKNAQEIGVPSFMTEFGSVANLPQGLEEANHVIEIADDKFQSWSYWQYKYFEDYTSLNKPAYIEGMYEQNGDVQTEKLKYLSRTYIYATCGVGVSMNFNPQTSKFNAKIKSSKDCEGMNTEIYLNEDLHYSGGYEVKFSENCKGCEMRSLGEKNYYEIVIGDEVEEGAEIDITIEAKNEIIEKIFLQ